MNNFYYHVPTKIFFGKGEIRNLGENLKKIGKRVLLVYGGGSIKKNGLYDKVIEEMEGANLRWQELFGVEPNPRIETVRKGVALCKAGDIEVVLAVGGGSVIDCAKIIASGACYEKDPWEQVIDSTKITKALPIAAVLTLAATGSEMDGYAVISDLTKNEKWSTGNDITKPVFSILDPTYTYTVSAKQTAAGVADVMSHGFENYFTREKGAYLPARFCEGIFKTCIHYGPIAIKEPENYEARANLMWASSMAINGVCSCGENTLWSVHPMEHELSAFYDITHGVGLTILTPNWMEYVLSDKTVWRFVEYGRNVWGILEGTDMDIARSAIGKTRDFFDLLKLPKTLREVGIDETYFDLMAQKAVTEGLEDGFIPLTKEDVKKIFEMSL